MSQYDDKGQGMHSCGDNKIGCVLNEPSGKLIVFIKDRHFEAKFCPYCGYQPERLSEKDRKVCDSPNTPTKGSESSRND
jgi:hypothetical protein